MPVTLSGNARSQPEHPQSTEPTELSGTELGLNREARSPWTCMRKKGQCLSSIDTSMLQHRDNSVLLAALLWLCLAVREDLQLDLPQSHPSLLLPYLTPLESCRDRMLGGYVVLDYISSHGARAAAVKQQRWRCESQWISGLVTCHVTRQSRKYVSVEGKRKTGKK
ncbi:hypothetical protein JOQ06_005911 [Pogonophryne albipinna]|uniref:Uncharacterized protein n=1 Tax=Pogonophryne albipinna TaxID=1090488 RepID=A0AAD6BG93_9TELE|nr:hypothetical protein JOQ06_005911 [Pogonophryne albipinna]